MTAEPKPGPDVEAARSDRPIFIVACPRSGTTLLQLMLHAGPRIAIPPENRVVLEAYARRGEFGDLRLTRNRVQLARWIARHRKYKDMHIPRKVLRRRIVRAPATLGSGLGAVFRQYAKQHDKPRWGDKRPMYLNHLPTVLALFPDAQIIHIVRDGRDCVASLKRMPWWRTGSVSAITRWVQSMNMGQRARTSLRPDQYYELRYEDLVSDPRSELTKLCAFLGEEFSEEMLEPSSEASAAVPARKVWHERTQQAVSAAAVSRWTEELELWEIGVIERLGRRHFQHYGYPLTGQRAPAIKLAAAAWDLARREWFTYRGRLADRRRTREYPWPVAAQLTREQRRLADLNGERLRARKHRQGRRGRARRRARRQADRHQAQ